MDLVAAEGLALSGVVAVLNTEKFISGRYPNEGPSLLLAKGVKLYDMVPEELWSLADGTDVSISSDNRLRGGSASFQLGAPLTAEAVDLLLTSTRANLTEELDRFIENTLEYAKREKDIVLGPLKIPPLEHSIHDRPVVVVVRGRDYRQDLKIISDYIRERHPLLLAVDGGADALLEQGLKPDIILGDMDSVSNRALQCGAQLIVHGYSDGRAPGLERLYTLGLKADVFCAPGTSEDVAMLLAHAQGADLIVAVGTHSNMVDFLDKGRPGMASTFLTRLRVGDKLVDARGLSKLYQTGPGPGWIAALFGAALLPVLALLYASSDFRHLVSLLIYKLSAAVLGG